METLIKDAVSDYVKIQSKDLETLLSISKELDLFKEVDLSANSDHNKSLFNVNKVLYFIELDETNQISSKEV